MNKSGIIERTYSKEYYNNVLIKCDIFKDDRVSWVAKGVYCHLNFLVHTNDSVGVENICANNKQAIDELVKYGYIEVNA